jgi:hypothetical protein
MSEILHIKGFRFLCNRRLLVKILTSLSSKDIVLRYLNITNNVIIIVPVQKEIKTTSAILKSYGVKKYKLRLLRIPNILPFSDVIREISRFSLYNVGYDHLGNYIVNVSNNKQCKKLIQKLYNDFPKTTDVAKQDSQNLNLLEGSGASHESFKDELPKNSSIDIPTSSRSLKHYTEKERSNLNRNETSSDHSLLNKKEVEAGEVLQGKILPDIPKSPKRDSIDSLETILRKYRSEDKNSSKNSIYHTSMTLTEDVLVIDKETSEHQDKTHDIRTHKKAIPQKPVQRKNLRRKFIKHLKNREHAKSRVFSGKDTNSFFEEDSDSSELAFSAFSNITVDSLFSDIDSQKTNSLFKEV